MNRAATWDRIHLVIRESKDDLVRQGQPSGGQALIGHLASRVVELQAQLDLASDIIDGRES